MGRLTPLLLAASAGLLLLATGERAVALSPRSPAAYGVIGDAAVELGRYERAVEASQAMVDLRPDLASYSRVAYARELHGDLPGAIVAMRRAINAGTPRSEATNWARVQLGHLYVTTGDLDAAEREYRIALRALPDYVHAIAGRGRVAAARGDLPGAIAHDTQAQGLVPLPELAAALSDLYVATGDGGAVARQDDLVRAIARHVPASRLITVPSRRSHKWYLEALACVDVGCCPLGPTPFNANKSPQKAWEWALTGSPVVASPTVDGDPDVHLGFEANGGLIAHTAAREAQWPCWPATWQALVAHRCPG